MIDKAECVDVLDLMEVNKNLEEENTILKTILVDHLSDEDRRYYEIKHGIDLGV